MPAGPSRIYEEAKVAWFGVCCPIVDQENKSPISFPLGFVGGFPTAAAIKMNADGCKNVADANGDLPVAEVFHNLFLNGWKSAGRTDAVPSIKFPLAPGDYSSQVAQIPDDTDCFFGNVGEAVWPSILTAAKKLGRTMRFYGPQGNLDAKVAKDYPAETEGAVVMGVYPDITTPVFDDYRAALEKYKAPTDGSIDWNSLGGLGTWTAYVAFADIISHMKGDITAQTLPRRRSEDHGPRDQGHPAHDRPDQGVHRRWRQLPAHLQPRDLHGRDPGRQAHAARLERSTSPTPSTATRCRTARRSVINDVGAAVRRRQRFAVSVDVGSEGASPWKS